MWQCNMGNSLHQKHTDSYNVRFRGGRMSEKTDCHRVEMNRLDGDIDHSNNMSGLHEEIDHNRSRGSPALTPRSNVSISSSYNSIPLSRTSTVEVVRSWKRYHPEFENAKGYSDIPPDIMCGRVKFQTKTGDTPNVGHYAMIDSATNPDDLINFATLQWAHNIPPRVVLNIISNGEQSNMWRNDGQVSDFQIGLMQAASRANMWIVTDGLRNWLLDIVGEAVNEVLRSRIEEGVNNDMYSEYNSDLMLIGLAAKESLAYGQMLAKNAHSALDKSNENNVVNIKTEKYEENLEPNHSHYLIMKTADDDSGNINQKDLTLMQRKFIQSFQARRATTGISSFYSKEELPLERPVSVPCVGLLVQGGVDEIDTVYWMLTQRIPVVIVKEKSAMFASGLLADAFKEGKRLLDSDYVERVVKPKMLEDIAKAFPEEYQLDSLVIQQCRNRILDCIKHGSLGKNQLLTIIDVNSQHDDLKDLSKFILTAIFTSEVGRHQHRVVNRNLRLALNWNRPDVAKILIQNKAMKYFQINNDIFFETLVAPNRESFVRLFLKLGYSVFEFMVREQSYLLYTALMSNMFFMTNCLPCILGSSAVVRETEFLYGKNSPLNQIVIHLTSLRNFIQFNDLRGDSYSPLITADKSMRERKALMQLIFWSVLTNKPALAKQLWYHTTQPMSTALMISSMFFHLYKLNTTDLDVQVQLYQSSTEFSKLAIDLLNLAYKDSTIFAYRTLFLPNEDLHDKTALDIALNGRNKFFISHPCCQAAILETWEGSIKIKNIKNYFLPNIMVPKPIKILSSLILIFPMYLWISYDKEFYSGEESVMETSVLNGTQSPKLSPKEIPLRHRRKVSNADSDSVSELPLFRKTGPHFFKKIYLLWTAPIAIFWLHFFVYCMHLIMFSYWILQPFCGDFKMTCILGAWNVIMLIEHCRRVISWRSLYPTMALYYNTYRLFLNLYVIVIFSLSAVHHQVSYDYNVISRTIDPVLSVDYMSIKVLQSFGLLLYFYDMLAFIIPVSPKLGPLFVTLGIMIRQDIIHWLLLWSMCFISGGLAIYITMFPLRKLNIALVREALLTGLSSIFATPRPRVAESAVGCEDLYQEQNYICEVSHNASVISQLEHCPMNTPGSEILILQLQFFTNLVFYIVMFAIFSLTFAKTKSRSLEIWKYRFYRNVADYASRPVLPAPLSVLVYPFAIGKLFVDVGITGAKKCQECCDKVKESVEETKVKLPFDQMKSYLKHIGKKEDENKLSIAEYLTILEEESEDQRKTVKRILDRVIDIEQNQKHINLRMELLTVHLESLKHSNQKTNKPKEIEGHNTGHSEARKSPYPGTEIQRFAVFEKDMYWSIKYDAYDPIHYSRPVEQYPEHLQPWVDRDKEAETGVSIMSPKISMFDTMTDASSISSMMPCILPEPVYNEAQVFVTPTGEQKTVNRITFISDGEHEAMYSLDFMGLPINPIGRTGMRGRGALCRYGPNHYICAVISRWRNRAADAKYSTSVDTAQGTSSNILEILLVDDHLPMTALVQKYNQYGGLCEYFDSDVLKEGTNLNIYDDYDNEDMVQYFSQFASTDEKRKSKSYYVAHGFSGSPISRGYVDSSQNTDNAWREMEVWHFHYKYKDGFQQRLENNPAVSWLPVTNGVNSLTQSESCAVQEVCKLHKANFGGS